MKNLKEGTQLIIAETVKANIGSGSSSGYVILEPGQAVCAVSINEKSVKVAFNINFNNWAPEGGFAMQTLMLGRIALEDFKAGKILNVLSEDLQERSRIRRIILNCE